MTLSTRSFLLAKKQLPRTLIALYHFGARAPVGLQLGELQLSHALHFRSERVGIGMCLDESDHIGLHS